MLVRRLLLALLLAIAPAQAFARERLVRHIGADELLPESVVALAQDPDGFVWIGTAGGLVRFDGTRLVPWAPATIRGSVSRIAVTDGELIAAIWEGPVFELRGADVTALLGPDGAPLTDARDLAFDHRGRLWIATGDRVLRRDGGRWSTPLAGTGAARAHRVRPSGRRTAADPEVYALTAGAVWAIDAGDRVTRYAELPRDPAEPDPAEFVLPMPDGSVVVSRWAGDVERYRDGVLVHRARGEGVPRELARRGDVVWVAHDRELAAIHPDGRRDVLPLAESIANRAICMLVDREGSLWVGNGRGVFQFPEPDTAAWNVHDGLPRDGGLRLAQTAEGIWITHWGYRLSRIAAPDRTPRAEIMPATSLTSMCTDAGGVLWAVRTGLGWTSKRLVSRHPGQPFVDHLELGGGARCTRGRDGAVYLAGEHTIWRAEGDRVVELARHPLGAIPELAEGASGTMWLVGGGRICELPVRELASGGAGWRCRPLAFDDVQAVLEMPSGALWLASSRQGVARWTRGEGLAPLAPSGELPSTSAHVLEPARDGGAWLGGAGFLLRVEEQADSWVVRERLGPSNGVVGTNAIDLLEDDAGTLWVTTSAGVLELPRSARHRAPPVVTPTVIELVVDGRPREVAAAAELAAGANSVGLAVAPLSYRDPSAIRYRVRLHGGGDWSRPSPQSAITLVDLPAGDYRLEVAASADGGTWVSTRTAPSFTVVRPWYLRPWAWAMYVAVAVAVAFAIRRVRRGFARRLERQRLSIAMDLHDDVASSLGGIGMMAGLTADARVDERTRQAAAARIARTAHTLGESLASIVTSLRGDPGELRSLAAELAERASMLFPDLRPRLELDFPAVWPAVKLDRRLERNLKLIALEALHNAAKHADAGVVTLAARTSGDELTLSVTDDGRGTPRGSARGGLGLVSMKRRAERIGARFTIASPAVSGRGTRVAVALDLARARAADGLP